MSVILLAVAGAVGTPSLLADQSVTLAWDPILNAAGYNLYSREDTALAFSRTNVGPSTQTTVTGLKEGQRYLFQVTAYNALGAESLPSNEVTYDVRVALRIIPPSGTPALVRVQFTVAPGRWYELQASQDLQSWETIWQTSGAVSNMWVDFQDLGSATTGFRFYRVQTH